MEAQEDSTCETQAAFRFVGDSVNPERVTSRMRMAPSRAHAKGEPVGGRVGRRHHTGLWLLESPLSQKCSLDHHLVWLLDVLEPRASAIREMVEAGLYANFFCGFMTAASDYRGHMRLEPSTLRRMASLGVALDVHVYYVGEEDEED